MVVSHLFQQQWSTTLSVWFSALVLFENAAIYRIQRGSVQCIFVGTRLNASSCTHTSTFSAHKDDNSAKVCVRLHRIVDEWIVISPTWSQVDDINAAITDLKAKNIRTLSAEPRIGAHGKPVMFLHPKDCDGVLVELEEAWMLHWDWDCWWCQCTSVCSAVIKKKKTIANYPIT